VRDVFGRIRWGFPSVRSFGPAGVGFCHSHQCGLGRRRDEAGTLEAMFWSDKMHHYASLCIPMHSLAFLTLLHPSKSEKVWESLTFFSVFVSVSQPVLAAGTN